MCWTESTAAAAARELLPTNVTPVEYSVALTPDLVKHVFAGEETVRIKVNEETATIVLHAVDIEIQEASVTSTALKTTQSLPATSITFDKENETVSLVFPQALAAGTTAELHIKFTGILNANMAGFYRSEYTTAEGEKRYMAVTQFEATDARRAFPSWDEPLLKAVFNITLRVPKDRVALSNMDPVSEHIIEETGLRQVQFAPTPIMSTYLVAFVVGELDHIEAYSSKNNIRCRVYTLKGLSQQGAFALNVCTRTLDFFEEYFDIAYPLPKMDLVAVPDFAAGAMENWGLVTYRQAYLLYDEKVTSANFKQHIAYIIGHELAHQWFGNLVTMEWWTHLWLNEGFATWVGWLATDHLFPEWDVWTQFVTSEFRRALDLDALRSSHPIEVEVKKSSEITQIFDAVSYSKGASVIRMLVYIVGKDAFIRGIRSYLRKHTFGNASTQDLWASLAEAANKPVAEIMASWTQQIGYPVITVNQDASGSLVIRQNRYLSGGDVKEDEDTSLWWVPLALSTADGVDKSSPELFNERQISVSLPKLSTPGFFYKLNSSQVGFYRTVYPEANLLALGEGIQHGKFAAADRVGIISDAFALASSGLISTRLFLRLLEFYKTEKDYV